MDYEIKARLAQVSPTMAANVLRNLRRSRREEAGRKEAMWEGGAKYSSTNNSN